MKTVRSPWLIAGFAAVGLTLFVWTVWSVGPSKLALQLGAVRSVLPIVLVLAAVRFVCQAAGWRLAMSTPERPSWTEAFMAVVAGEATGYFAWGPFSREPVKALLVSHRIPGRAALTAALAERLAYTLAASVLAIIGLGVLATVHGRAMVFWIGLATFVIVIAGVSPQVAKRLPEHRPEVLSGLAALAAAQELINVLEAWLVLAMFGVTIGVSSVVVFEGVSRLLNAAGQFIPAKLGVAEAISAAIAGTLQIGSVHGLSLALARRARSLTWSAVGMAILAYRASLANHRAALEDLAPSES